MRFKSYCLYNDDVIVKLTIARSFCKFSQAMSCFDVPGGAHANETIGYHNPYSTHASLKPDEQPPSYCAAIIQHSSFHYHTFLRETIPDYSCDVHMGGYLNIKTELCSPFTTSRDNNWHQVYVVLHGTQLNIYQVKKSLFRCGRQMPGKLLRTYSLQHAEAGIACDWNKGKLSSKVTLSPATSKSEHRKL
jgi:hypothetical protein